MNDTNIIGVNVANFISVTIMAFVGMLLVNAAMKAYRAKMGATPAGVPMQSGTSAYSLA